MNPLFNAETFTLSTHARFFVDNSFSLDENTQKDVTLVSNYEWEALEIGEDGHLHHITEQETFLRSFADFFGKGTGSRSHRTRVQTKIYALMRNIFLRLQQFEKACAQCARSLRSSEVFLEACQSHPQISQKEILHLLVKKQWSEARAGDPLCVALGLVRRDQGHQGRSVETYSGFVQKICHIQNLTRKSLQICREIIQKEQAIQKRYDFVTSD